VPPELERIARAIWPAAAGLLLGLAIGGVWTLLQSDRYAAETHVVLSGPSAARLAPAVETLANGSVVEGNVKQTLRLGGAPNLSASLRNTILAIRAEAGSKERARQIDAEAAQVVTQLVPTRFGSQGLRASLLDPAHVTEQTSPTPGRNLTICGLLGLLGGGAFAYPRGRRRGALPMEGGAVDPDVERRLKKRIEEVTKRERAMARRAGELAKREADLDQRRGKLDEVDARLEQRDAEVEQRRGKLDELDARLNQRTAELEASNEQLTARAGEVAESERELEARAQTPPPPEPIPEPEPTALPAPPPPVTRVGSTNVNHLQRLVDAQTGAGAPAEQVETWTTYLFFLREHAASDGSLPAQFDGLVEDVFGSLDEPGPQE
jgi:hypothetical protein